MKHYVIVPFYPYAKIPLKTEVLFSDECPILSVALQHLQSYLLPSLINSTTHDFTVLLGVKEDLEKVRPELHSSLVSLSKTMPFKMEVLDWFSYYRYVTEQGDRNVIATRIDHDDCFGRDSLELIQDRASFRLSFEFFAFMKGAIYWEKSKRVHEYVSPTWRDGVSSFSASPTMYCDWNIVHALPVHGHACLTSITNPLGIDLVPGENHFLDYEHPLSWLYVRHNQNRSRESWYKYGERLKYLRLGRQFGIAR